MAGDRARDGGAAGERPEPAVPAGVIAVVRAATAAEARTIVHGLVRAAVPAIELTLTVPEALTHPRRGRRSAGAARIARRC